VVVTVENLGTNLVGAYGNAINSSPNIDRFAAQAIVADQFWMDSPFVVECLASMWSGQHKTYRDRSATTPGKTPNTAGIQSPGLLVTDSPKAFALGNLLLDGECIFASPAAKDQFAFSSLVSQSFEHWIARMDSLPWLWIHSRGLAGTWDAPYEYRCSMCGEGDPPPPVDTTPPFSQLQPNFDPDILFGWACGAGAQAMVIDEVWEWMQSALQQLDISPTCLLAFAGVLGFPLGEHLRVGCSADSEHMGEVSKSTALYSELLHTPLIIRPGNSLPLGVRFAPFLQPHHLGQLLDAWIERDGWQPSTPSKDSIEGQAFRLEKLVALSSVRRESWPATFRAAMAAAPDQTALMAPGWSAIWDTSNGQESTSCELFAMPDDRWQQNEIGSRAPEIVQHMQRLRDDWLRNSEDSPSNLGLILSRMDKSLWRPTR
jgi:hypothetical protein